MKTDAELHLMLRKRRKGKTQEQAAARAGMHPTTARKHPCGHTTEPTQTTTTAERPGVAPARGDGDPQILLPPVTNLSEKLSNYGKYLS